MYKIKRKINLEDFRNRFNSEGVSLAKNIIIPESETLIREVSDNLPLIEGNILRYGTMLYILRNIKLFLKNMPVYRLCKRNNDVVLAEILDDYDSINTEVIFSHNILDSRKTLTELIEEDGVYHLEETEFGTIESYAINLDNRTVYYAEIDEPITNGVSIGQYFIVANNYEFIFRKFSIPEDSGSTAPMMERMLHFYNFAECAKYEEKNSEKCPLSLRENLIPIKLYLEQESEDLGVFTSLIDDWVPSKVYFLGDKVLDGSGVVWTLISGRRILEEPVQPLLKSFYNEQKEKGDDTYIFFPGEDTPTGALVDLEHTYIREDDDGNYYILRAYYDGNILDEHWKKEADSSITEYTAITESRLNAFYKPDIDDDSNPLPFRVIWDTNNKNNPTLVSGGTYEGEVYYETSLPFQGVTATTSGDTITISYSGGSENIIYTDVYKYAGSFKHFNFKTDANDTNPTKLFAYINIDFDSGISVGEKISSSISVRIERDGTESQDVPYFKEEALIGIQDLTVDISNLRIERGKAAAWERHSILGEISSFDDLETYRNGFFTMKSD